MESNVYIKACELAKAIGESPEAEKLRKAEQKIRDDKIANNLTERWQKVYQRISDLQDRGEELSEQDERSLEFIEAKVENHPLILDFIDAHKEFTQMLEEIDKVLNGALTFEADSQTEGDVCSGCPSKGSCNIENGNH